MVCETNHALGCHGAGAMAMPILALMRTRHTLMTLKSYVSFLMILAMSLSDGADFLVHFDGRDFAHHLLRRSAYFCLLAVLR